MLDSLPSGWGLAAALNQWLLYGAALFAMGSALSSLWLPLPPAAKGLAGVVGRRASVLAVVFYALAVGLVGADMLGASNGLLNPRSWELGMRTTLSSSAAFGVPAMGVLFWGFVRPGKRRRLFFLAGIALTVASFLVTGHPAVTAPRWLVVPAYALHILGAAFWLGALAPLVCAVTVLRPAEAWTVIAAFSRRAVYAVGAIVVSGVVLGAIHLGTAAALTASDYGQRLLIKGALAAVVIAIAAYNKIVLTPALARGEVASQSRLRLCIGLEIGLLVLILGAAVSLTLVPPPALD